MLPPASSNQPGRQAGNRFAPLRCHRSPAAPIRFCSRWGFPCPLRYRRGGALLPHPFTLTTASRGGLLSVALSLGSPPPAVSRHRIPVEPGLSSGGFPPAAVQPSGSARCLGKIVRRVNHTPQRRRAASRGIVRQTTEMIGKKMALEG